MDLSIVIPAFNEEAYLPATLESVRAEMERLPIRAEIVVVDNNSTDATARVAAAGGATVVFEPVNQISRARNAGARVAQGRNLIFLDADTILPEGMARQVVERLERGDVCGGGSVVALDRHQGWFMERFLATWNQASRRLGLAAGCFVFCLREAHAAVGGFDEGVYAGEEVWFSRRLKRWGRKRGMRFEVFESPRLISSGRKAEWFSPWRMSLQLVTLLIFPLAARWRGLCGIWYRRPEGAGGTLP